MRETGHEYDGIAEYDNPLPGWWTGIFVLTIVFSALYVAWFHLGPGETMHQAFEARWAEHAALRAEADKDLAIEVDEAVLAELARNPSATARGRIVFETNCVSCHLDDGRGQIGANLTDEFQIHGAGRLDLFATIRDGVADKGMIAWGPTLPPRDLAAVAAYVSTLRGTNAPGGKPPEGEKVGALP